VKSVFEKSVRQELCNRIGQLNESTSAAWGKMNVSQMISHNILWNQMALCKTKHKQVFIGRLFGKMALRSMIKNEKPIQRNMPTLPELRVSATSADFDALKKQWVESTEEFGLLTNDHKFIHSFFGKLNKEQTGLLAYKHIDHHLRQFGV
jgi:hypothetical protein